MSLSRHGAVFGVPHRADRIHGALEELRQMFGGIGRFWLQLRFELNLLLL